MHGYLTPRSTERWALEVVEKIAPGAVNEDSRVEFKQQMPDDVSAVARRLAGHANAAMGEPILWLAGVSAGGKLEPAILPADPANYWARVWSVFEGGVHPELVDVTVDFNGVPLLAFGFNCERMPYVVRTGKDSPSLEVPWRDGTRITSATRSQILRMTGPLARAPKVEVRRTSMGEGMGIIAFVVPPTAEPIMLPAHRCVLELSDQQIAANEVSINAERIVSAHPTLREAVGQGVYFYGPGEIVIIWLDLTRRKDPQPCKVRLTFEPTGAEVVITEGLPRL